MSASSMSACGTLTGTSIGEIRQLPGRTANGSIMGRIHSWGLQGIKVILGPDGPRKRRYCTPNAYKKDAGRAPLIDSLKSNYKR